MGYKSPCILLFLASTIKIQLSNRVSLELSRHHHYLMLLLIWCCTAITHSLRSYCHLQLITYSLHLIYLSVLDPALNEEVMDDSLDEEVTEELSTVELCVNSSNLKDPSQVLV